MRLVRQRDESVFVVGYPGTLGGADTELWHVLRLWRENSLRVVLLPTSTPLREWRNRCERIGIATHDIGTGVSGSRVPGLEGAIVVSFCNREFLQRAAEFRRLRCRIAWVSCMTWAFPEEIAHYHAWGPFHAHVFQSQYQRDRLLARLRANAITTERCHLIRGAFESREFPFQPRPRNDERFVVGRLARPDADKWHSETWKIYGRIDCPGRQARVMGWSDAVARKLGPPPQWAQALRPCAEPSLEFLRTLHCLVAINGGAEENWPRVALEAMAAGVPVVAENRWGWREMIEHGVNGLLGNSPQEIADLATKLANDETLRLRIAATARERLDTSLANGDRIWQGWKQLFDSL